MDEWAQVDGLKFRFQRCGRGPALVLVHGLLGYSFSWRFAAPLLAAERETFALDMPGSGYSDVNDGLDCRLQSAAKRLLAFMDAMRISSCDLIGSSYGGTTALMAAAQDPERIRSLVLVSPANPWSKIGSKRLALLQNSLVAATFPRVTRQFPHLHRYFLRRMYGNRARVTEETVRGYNLPVSRPGVLEHAVRIGHSWEVDMEELQRVLPNMAKIPTLLLWGSKDRVVAPASAELLRGHLQCAESLVMKGAGHLPYEECPEEFSRVVLDFFRRHSSPAVAGGK
jgi:pimeloyl-ACP methyl ester carboxylesterase